MFKQQILAQLKQFDVDKLRIQYDSHPYYGKIDVPNFLPETVTQQCADELDNLPLEQGKKFTRKGSCMWEYNNLSITPVQEQLVNVLHSGEFIRWVEDSIALVELVGLSCDLRAVSCMEPWGSWLSTKTNSKQCGLHPTSSCH